MTPPAPFDAEGDFDVAVLGGGLPAEVEALIRDAGLIRQDRDRALPLLMEARALAPRHPATLIALYRFHFYGHDLRAAREVAWASLRVAREAIVSGAPEDRPCDDELVLSVPITDEQARFDPSVRFYLFTLKGLAYLSLRLGDLDLGRRALQVLQTLDPQDRVGGAVLAQVLARAEAGLLDDDDDDDSTVLHPQASAAPSPRGWSTP